MFPNTPTTVPVTPTPSSNAPGVGRHRQPVVPTTSPAYLRPHKKVLPPLDSRAKDVRAVQRTADRADRLGALLITPPRLGVASTPVCPRAPQKSTPFQSRIPVKVKATSTVEGNILQSPVPVTPSKVSVSQSSLVVPAAPARGLPYRAPSAWAPRRGIHVTVAAVEAGPVVPKIDSAPVVTAHAPASPVKTIVCGPQLGKFKMIPLGRKLPTVVARPEVPSTPKPARTTNKLTKVKVPRSRDASATLMLPGVVDQAPKTPGCELEVKVPAAPKKTSKAKVSSVNEAEGVVRITYTGVSAPVKSVSDRCAMRSTANTQVLVTAATPPRKLSVRTPTAPTKIGKALRPQPIEEIVRLEYCVVDVPIKSVSDVCAMRLTSIENVIAAEYVVVDKGEIATAEHRVEMPAAPRKTMKTRSLRFLKKATMLDFSRDVDDE
jgi:hypothetical protein